MPRGGNCLNTALPLSMYNRYCFAPIGSESRTLRPFKIIHQLRIATYRKQHLRFMLETPYCKYVTDVLMCILPEFRIFDIILF